MNSNQKPVSMIDAVPWLCAVLSSGRVSTGQLARLRRCNLDTPVSDVWWVLALVENNKLQREIGPIETSQWILLVKLLAIMTRRISESVDADARESDVNSAHAPGMALGRALFECGDRTASRAGFSELRLAALLEAQCTQFNEKITRACRMLKAKQQPFNCHHLARLIQHKAGSQAYEGIRQEIARDYYRRAAKSIDQTEEVTA